MNVCFGEGADGQLQQYTVYNQEVLYVLECTCIYPLFIYIHDCTYIRNMCILYLHVNVKKVFWV